MWVGQTFTSGDWMVKEGNEEVFLERWAELADWCIENYPGTKGLYLIKDRQSERHYVSFGAWADFNTVTASRSRPRFLEMFKACRSLCDRFVGSDYVAAVVHEASPGGAGDGISETSVMTDEAIEGAAS